MLSQQKLHQYLRTDLVSYPQHPHKPKQLGQSKIFTPWSEQSPKPNQPSACVKSQAYTGKAHTQGFWFSLQTHTRCCGSSTGACLPCSASLSVPCLSQLLWSSWGTSANKRLFSWGYSSRMLWVFCSAISDDFRVTTAKMPKASVQLLCWFRKKALNRVTLTLFLDSYLKRYHATPQRSPGEDEGKGLSHYKWMHNTNNKGLGDGLKLKITFGFNIIIGIFSIYHKQEDTSNLTVIWFYQHQKATPMVTQGKQKT